MEEASEVGNGDEAKRGKGRPRGRGSGRIGDWCFASAAMRPGDVGGRVAAGETALLVRRPAPDACNEPGTDNGGDEENGDGAEKANKQAVQPINKPMRTYARMRRGRPKKMITEKVDSKQFSNGKILDRNIGDEVLKSEKDLKQRSTGKRLDKTLLKKQHEEEFKVTSFGDKMCDANNKKRKKTHTKGNCLMCHQCQRNDRGRVKEKELEGTLQGVSMDEVKCKASIVDFHRSCKLCSYDLCLACCWELRKGEIPRGEEVMNVHLCKNRGREYAFGNSVSLRRHMKTPSTESHNGMAVAGDPNNPLLLWKANSDGSIPCPPKEIGGCCASSLELKCLLPENMISELEYKANKIIKTKAFAEAITKTSDKCPCIDHSSKIRTNAIHKAANRKGSSDNYLYCPDATDIQEDDLFHFQMHWSKGEPVIVSNVLRLTSGLRWEPLVMWRALRERKTNGVVADKQLVVNAMDCLDWCQVEINIHQFFMGYMRECIGRPHWPEILKLKDWPPSSSFDQRLPRHSAEFITALPFPEYTNPQYGPLNLAARIPAALTKPDLGPKTCIAYGYFEEGDSVTKLHCNMSDVVNILMHTAEVSYEAEQLDKIAKITKTMREQDLQELFGVSEPGTMQRQSSQNESNDLDMNDLQSNDFASGCQHIDSDCSEQQNTGGVEPWTFEQKVGEAVFIPAGCPHQVRNLKSCINVALDFVSPENVGECVKLNEEVRHLPSDHRAKADKLEIKRIALIALQVVNFLDPLLEGRRGAAIPRPVGAGAGQPPCAPSTLSTSTGGSRPPRAGEDADDLNRSRWQEVT
uniref:JmjC domain-containing protein n=1 Tax=Leersia perrieri TaxID=77586 RepID=A0A0D9VUG8_9ORYZ